MKVIALSTLNIIVALATLAGIAPMATAQTAMTVAFSRPGSNEKGAAYLSDRVDVSPQFPGGEVALRHFINAERHYPKEAYDGRVEGRVVCGFVVDTDGSIINVRVHRGSMQCLNEEACRIISAMPRWNAGEVDGVKVPVYYMLTIPFRL